MLGDICRDYNTNKKMQEVLHGGTKPTKDIIISMFGLTSECQCTVRDMKSVGNYGSH